MTDDAKGWRAIEREAREQAQLERDAIEATPLQVGQHVAWVEASPFGYQTDDLSLIHRVAVATDEKKPETFCGERIPAAVRRFTLTPALLHTMTRCRWCEMAYGQSSAARQDATLAPASSAATLVR